MSRTGLGLAAIGLAGVAALFGAGAVSDGPSVAGGTGSADPGRSDAASSGALVAILPTPDAASPGPLLDVEFLFHDRHVYVPVTIGETGPHQTLLDTGATGVALDTELADRLNLAVDPAGTIRGAGEHRVRYGTAAAPDIRVGGTIVPVDRVGVLPLDSILAPFTGRAAPAVLGMPFFAERVVELDFEARRVRVWEPDDFEPAPGSVAIPYRLESGRPHVELFVELPDGVVERVDAMVDLGAKPSLLFGPAFVERTGALGRIGRTVRASLGAGVGGETRFAFARLPRTRLGSLEREGVVAGFDEAGMLPADGTYEALLGADFLRRYRVAFDHAGSRLWLAPVEVPSGAAVAATSPDRFDRTGLFVIAPRPDRIVVHRVVPGSPAAEAGMRPGDRLVAVDGRNAAGIGVDGLRRRFADPATGRLRLQVERGGATLTLPVTPGDLL